MSINQADIEDTVRRKYYRTYIYCTNTIAAGLITFLYGITTLPASLPIDNRDLQQYQITTSIEQQAKDLRTHQLGTVQFKIAISGVGIFIFGIYAAIYYNYRANQEIDTFYKTKNRRNRQQVNLVLTEQKQ